jgi:hypothetical protein
MREHELQRFETVREQSRRRLRGDITKDGCMGLANI